MDATRNVFWRLRRIWAAASEASPEEKEQRNERLFAKTDHRPSIAVQQPGQHYDPARLAHFRLLVGITQHESFRAPSGWKIGMRPVVTEKSRSAPNMGLYTHIIDQEVKSKKSYVFFTRLINICLGAQLIVAATLTALGAANGSRAGVTVFGALNTVIAGIMTFLKGSGLPNRLKYFQHEWASLREYIEQRERDIICGYDFDIPHEIEKIRETYEHIKNDIEANTPDRFVSNSRGINGPNPSSTMSRTPSMMMKSGSEAGTDSMRQSYMQGALHHNNNNPNNKPKSMVIDRVTEVGDMEKRMESFTSSIFHPRDSANAAAAAVTNSAQDHLQRATSFGSHLYEDAHGLRSKLHSKLREVNELEKEISQRGSNLFDQGHNSLNSATAQFQQAGQDIQSGVARAAERNEAVAREALQQSSEAASAAIAQRQAAALKVVEEGASRARGFAHETVERGFGGLGAHVEEEEERGGSPSGFGAQAPIAPVPPPPPQMRERESEVPRAPLQVHLADEKGEGER